MGAPAIQISNAHLDYEHEVLFDHLSLVVPGGKWTSLLGHSGVGKTSLLRLIAGLKTDATALSPIQASDGQALRGRMAYLAQQEILLPWLSCLDNVMIGSRLRNQSSDQERIEQATKLLVRVGLSQYLQARPNQLSGGMKQRVLLARTLFENKPIVLLDEPFAALDVVTRTVIQELAFELLKDRTVLLVTHDPLEALRLSHHIYIMSGKPAMITEEMTLETPPLRQLTDPMVLALQASILDKLSHSKEMTQC